MNTSWKVFPSRGLWVSLTVLISFTMIKSVRENRLVRLLTFLVFASCSCIPVSLHLPHFQIDNENVGGAEKPRTTWKNGRMIKNMKQLRDSQSFQKALPLLRRFDLNYYHPRTFSQCPNTVLGLCLIKKADRRLLFLEFCAQVTKGLFRNEMLYLSPWAINRTGLLCW